MWFELSKSEFSNNLVREAFRELWSCALLQKLRVCEALRGLWSCALFHKRRSDTEHHDFGGFDEGGDGFAFLQSHFSRGVGGDDGGDGLTADGEADLGEEAFDFEVDDAAYELVASADGAHHLAFGGVGALGFEEEGVEFGFGDAVMAAGGFDGFELAAVDPLFDGGVGDAEPQCGVTRG